MGRKEGRWDEVEYISLKLGPESLKTRLYQDRRVWTRRPDVVSVGTEGGCESAGVWVYWSDEQQHSQFDTTSVL